MEARCVTMKAPADGEKGSLGTFVPKKAGFFGFFVKK